MAGLRRFRGGTPEGIVQTASIGEGLGRYLIRQARRQRSRGESRRYIAFDPWYSLSSPSQDSPRRTVALNLEKNGVEAVSGGFTEVVPWLQARGLKVRHFNIDLPCPARFVIGTYDKTGVTDFLREASKVMVPNGKIFLTSEQPEVIETFELLARASGFKTRRVKNDLSRDKTDFFEQLLAWRRPMQFHRLECTFGLKKAFPRKQDRRKQSS